MHCEPWKEIANSHQGRDGAGEMYIKTKVAETYGYKFQFYCTLWLESGFRKGNSTGIERGEQAFCRN